MTARAAPTQKPRSLVTARRIVLLATVAALGVGAFFVSPLAGSQFNLPNFATAVRAEGTQSQRPVGFADVVEQVKPSVISVRVKVGSAPNSGLSERDLPPGVERFFRRFGMPDGVNPDPRGQRNNRNYTVGQGSGFFISADGYAVTNNHVVDHAESVEVTTDDGKTYTAKVIGTDPKTDLALIKVDGRNDFPYVKLADNLPRVGDWVIAVGNPFGLGGTVTAGIVSARGRDIGQGAYDYIQIDAPVNKGNSGGPTFDVDGNVIGVNTAIFSPSGGSVGIAFAIPAETVKTVITQLRDKGAVTRGWLGVQIQAVTADVADGLGMRRAEGALVAEAQPNSPASKAGIQAGDVITAVNAQPVRDERDLVRKIGALAPGSTVKLTIFRKGSEQTLTLALGELSRDQQQARANTNDDRTAPNSNSGSGDLPRLGLSLAPAGKAAGGSGDGVVVTAVDPDGPTAPHFKAGDIILDIGGKAVSTPADVRKAIADARGEGKRTVLMRVKSGDATRFVAVPVGRA